MENFINFAQEYRDYVVKFFGFLGNDGHRLFWLFLLASLLIAYVIYRKQRPLDLEKSSFISFLFPKSVWSTPAAWLDVRYFFFHGLIGHFILTGASLAGLYIGVELTIGSERYRQIAEISSPHSPALSFIVAVIVYLIVSIASSFISFLLHFLQHKIPLLWQFHKVHHAGEVMHPLSNFREHPIDNLTYNFIISLVTYYVYGTILMVIGFTPSDISIYGITILALIFNMAGYQLRHSHIWLKWPGKWSMVFGSPAHHHVHHSRHPDHLDKNFAFMFPFWDVLFGTYYMPEDNKDVAFGIVEDASELNSCLNLYIIPFRDAYRLLKKPKAPADTSIADS